MHERRNASTLPTEPHQVLFELSKDHFGLYAEALKWIPLVHSPENWSYWEECVRESAVLRHSIDVANEIKDSATHGDVDLMTAVRKLQQIEAAKGRNARASIVAIANEAINDLDERYQRQTPYSGHTTGFPTLDLNTDALTAKALWVIAARPSVGKTTLACNLVRTLAVGNKVPTAMFSLEMPSHLICQKLFHIISGVSQEQRKRHNLTEADFARLAGASASIVKAPLMILDSCRTIQSIGAEIRRLKSDCGTQVVVIDYLQRITIDGSKHDRWHDIGVVSNALKNFAMDNDITVVALAQVSRSVEKEDREPTLADLRGSAEIEADADVICFLWRQNGNLKLSIAKSRMGQIGMVPISANYDTGRMTEERQNANE